MNKYITPVKSTFSAFLSWQWVKRFLYWLVVSGGTVSECIFLIASIWVGINASVHPLMLKLMSETTTVTLSELAVAAFTGLPEVILGLAIVTTYGHIKFYCVHRKKSSLVWAILFGLPTLVFLSLTTWVLGMPVGYEMPAILVSSRVWAGYAYGLLSMLFMLMGKPDHADHVSDLQATIARLEQEMEAKHTAYSIEIENMTQLLKTSTLQINRLAEKASSLELRGLDAFPKVQSEWIEKGVKTVTLTEIEQVTGLSRQRINAAAKAEKFAKDNRNKDKVRVSSIIEWLKTMTVIESSNGHSIGDTPPLGLPVLTV